MTQLFEPWVGLVEVVPNENSEVGEIQDFGGYCTVVVWAANEELFRREVTNALADHDLRMIAAEEIEPVQVRMRHFEVPQELIEMANSVNDRNRVAIGTLHRYPRNQ